MSQSVPPVRPDVTTAKARIETCRLNGADGVALDLGQLGLTEVPSEVFLLTFLRTLTLSLNQFTFLPPEIALLSALTHLDLCGNQLVFLPPEIGRLQSLVELDATNNRLISLPPELRELKSLTTLYLHANPTLRLPAEILGPTQHDCYYCGATPVPAQAILAFYFTQENHTSG